MGACELSANPTHSCRSAICPHHTQAVPAAQRTSRSGIPIASFTHRLQISVSREGNVITARSEQWTNHGAALGREEPPSRVTMEGLHGELSAGGIAWDNGVLWMRAAAPPQPRAGGVAPPPEAAAPPEAAMVAAWVGQYQDQDGMTISIEAAEPAGAVAASSRQFQQAPGEVHGSLIVMFGVQGKMERGGPIHWENGSVWERVSPPAAGGAAAAAGARAPASTTGDPLAAPPQPAVANRAGGFVGRSSKALTQEARAVPAVQRGGGPGRWPDGAGSRRVR